jgi:hypothetical protein
MQFGAARTSGGRASSQRRTVAGEGDLGDRRGRLGPRLRCEPMFDLFLAPSSLRERGSEPCVKLPNRFIVKFVMDAFAQELTHKRVK